MRRAATLQESTMRVHVIQHVEFEGPGLIAEWAASRGYSLACSLAFAEKFPRGDEVDFLVVMGGPMAADDAVASPWLRAEKRFVAECIAAGLPVLGVCLGAQIIAEVLGGEVKRNPVKEIGWFPIEKTETGLADPLFESWPSTLSAGHWHGDTFEFPAGPQPVFSSAATVNQAYVFDRRVVGLQFHVEWTEGGLALLLENCADELAAGGTWVQTAAQIEDAAPSNIAENRTLLYCLLDAMIAEAAEQRSANAE
jgi:GMP synthase-like glutamine amidotransferase